MFRAHVTSGTYLRSIAHDMGQKPVFGAHLRRASPPRSAIPAPSR